MTSTAISLPFSFNVNGGVSSTTDPAKILQDRITLMTMTLLGERVMRPNYGTNVRGAAFENIGTAITVIEQNIQAGFVKWLPYLTLLTVTGSLDPQTSELNISITYNYGSTSTPSTVVVKTAILSQSGDLISEA